MSQPIHSVFSPHRQRMALIIASIVAQFALYVVVLVQFTQYFVYFYWICVGVSLAVSLFISTRTFKMAYKIAWIIPILLVPLIGGVMYIILGGSRKPHYRRAVFCDHGQNGIKTALFSVHRIYYRLAAHGAQRRLYRFRLAAVYLQGRFHRRLYALHHPAKHGLQLPTLNSQCRPFSFQIQLKQVLVFHLPGFVFLPLPYLTYSLITHPKLRKQHFLL